MMIKVYRYGLLSPTTHRDLVREQMGLAHRYANALTAIERGRRAAIREALALTGDAHVAALRAQLVTDEAAVALADAAIDAERARTRKRQVPMELTAALILAKQALFVTKSCLVFASRSAGRSEASLLRMKEIETVANDLKKNARAYSGLAWGTYQAVEEAADRQREATGKMGLSADHDPKFRRYTGEGLCAVHFQEGGGLPIADALAGKSTQIRIREIPNRNAPSSRSEKRRFYALDIRIGSTGRAPVWATFPMLMHRPIPDGSILSWAKVQHAKIGPRDEWYVTLTAKLPDTARKSAPKGGSVSINLGWRRLQDRSIRVATWVDDEGNQGTFALPEQFERLFSKSEDLRGLRDQNFDVVRPILVGWLHDREVPEWLTQKTRGLAQWRSCAKLGALVRHWRDNRFAGDDDAFLALEWWRYRDFHLWQYETGRREKMLRQRKDMYRVFARTLADRYETIVLPDFDLRRVAKRSDEAENEMARYQRFIACVSELTEALKNAAPKRVVEVHAVDLTHICRTCGTVDAFAAAEQIEHCCTGCGVTWDQDVNGAEVALRRYLNERERLPDAQPRGGARGDEMANEFETKKGGRFAAKRAGARAPMLESETARNSCSNATE